MPGSPRMPESITTGFVPSAISRSRTYAISSPFVSSVPIRAMPGCWVMTRSSRPVPPFPRVHLDRNLLELLQRGSEVLGVELVRRLPLLGRCAEGIPNDATRGEVGMVRREEEVLVALELHLGGPVQLDEGVREPVGFLDLLVDRTVHPDQLLVVSEDLGGFELTRVPARRLL